MRILFVILLLNCFVLHAQKKDPKTGLYQDDPVLEKIERTLREHYRKADKFTNNVAELNKNNYGEKDVPEFTDSVYAERIKFLNSQTPFEFEVNEDVLNYVKLFAKHRRTFTAIVLGRAELYFPLFEERLDKYDLPLELKYLSVVESALNPTAKSPAGAVGLWQFMYATGQSYGLHTTSYTDERRDPYLATEAACKYLKFLYQMYDDWSMALAAYNAGPGNVNRAIRRSGGKMTYWEIRPFLPRETRGYVPTFIAINYIMQYASDHNIYPRTPTARFYDIDSVQFTKPVDLNDVAEALNISLEYLESINPIYKTSFVPASDSIKGYLNLPVDKIGSFMANLDTIALWKRDSSEQESFIAYGKVQTHVVRSGESLNVIAYKYNTTVGEIKTWNNLRSSMIHPGQELKLHVPVKKPIEKSAPARTSSGGTTQSTAQANLPADKYYYYTIQSGDTLWDIANKKGVSVNTIKQLNHGLNERNLKVGQRIKIGVKS